MNQRAVLLLVLMLSIIALPSSVGAQDEPILQCEDADIQAAIEAAQTELTAAAELEGPAAFEALVQTRSNLALIDSQCLGLDFEGDKQEVLGPITIPAGVYKVTATTPGYLGIGGLILEGSCVSDYAERFGLFNVFEGGATEGAEMLLTSDGCMVMWEVAQATAPYTITFERIN